jgi:hypothetical protein
MRRQHAQLFMTPCLAAVLHDTVEDTLVETVRHYRAEWEARLFAGEGREAANAAQARQGASPLGERGLGDRRLMSYRTTACVLSPGR